MDKETLSNYGWIVICVLVLAVMLALATPFGNFIADGFKATFIGFGQTNNSMLDTMYDTTGTPPSIEYLQKKHQFEYYGTLSGAINDVNNGTIGENTDANKENAVAGIYTDNGKPYVVLLKDTTETARVQPSADVTINLGGHTLSSEDVVALQTPKNSNPNIVIDGRIAGSTIKVNHASGKNARAIQLYSGSVTINGGTYTGYSGSAKSTAIAVLENAQLSVTNAELTATCTSNGLAYTLIVNPNASATVSNCEITSICSDGGSFAVQNFGSITVSDCEINAYSNYISASGNNYTAYSVGVMNTGTATLNNCNVLGTNSGASNYKTLYVNGGTYESIGHGGLYLSGQNTTAYVENATIRECGMPEGYTTNMISNYAGFYIGGESSANNISVYMNNCSIYGSRQPIVLRGTTGEENNKLYISNSNINLDYSRAGVRIDSDTHRLYIGKGNNFTADNTDRQSAVISTNETYTQN